MFIEATGQKDSHSVKTAQLHCSHTSAVGQYTHFVIDHCLSKDGLELGQHASPVHLHWLLKSPGVNA